MWVADDFFVCIVVVIATQGVSGMNLTKDIHVRLSAEQHDKLKRAAHDRGISISTYLRWAALEAAAKAEQG